MRVRVRRFAIDCTEGSIRMSESIKRFLDAFEKDGQRVAKLAEALKPTPAMQELLEKTKQMLPKKIDFVPPARRIAYDLPDLPPVPTSEERNEYQSASVLIRALAEDTQQWRMQLPENLSPAILAVLYGGIQIHVQTLSQVSFHGIRIEGTLNGSPCSVLAHQATVQMLCYANETPLARPIGFIWDSGKTEV